MDILIPTYNRGEVLAKNIRLLNKLIAREGGGEEFRILVSNNCSADNTAHLLERLKNESTTELYIFTQNENLGGEGNVVFLLNQSSSEHIMFLGDDDFLPPGYLSFVLGVLARAPDTRAIVPGIASLYADGTVIPERNEKFEIREYSPGLASVRAISYLGHQISGTIFKRDGLADNYLNDGALRNLYPTIFFLGYSCMRGTTFYAPVYKILISQDNIKYWNYDASGLLSDIFKNYRLLLPDRPIVRLQLCVIVMYRQSTRLGSNGRPAEVSRAFFHLLFTPGLDHLVRLSLPVVFPILYVRRVIRYIFRKLR